MKENIYEKRPMYCTLLWFDQHIRIGGLKTSLGYPFATN